MKKLSEIGTRHEYVSGFVETATPIIFLTDADRRELVTEAIKRWEDWKWIHDADNKELFMKFLSEEGL